MSDPISFRLTTISSKDPRMRSEADMAFLKWCTSGGSGPPPPEDPLANSVTNSQSVNTSSAIVPRAAAPQAQMQMQQQMAESEMAKNAAPLAKEVLNGPTQ